MPDHEAIPDGALLAVKAWVKQEEPVMATAVTAAALAGVGDFLVAHNLTDADTLVQSAAPSVTAVVLVVIGLLFRRFVDSPSTAAKAAPTPAT